MRKNRRKTIFCFIAIFLACVYVTSRGSGGKEKEDVCGKLNTSSEWWLVRRVWVRIPLRAGHVGVANGCGQRYSALERVQRLVRWERSRHLHILLLLPLRRSTLSLPARISRAFAEVPLISKVIIIIFLQTRCYSPPLFHNMRAHRLLILARVYLLCSLFSKFFNLAPRFVHKGWSVIKQPRSENSENTEFIARKRYDLRRH